MATEISHQNLENKAVEYFERHAKNQDTAHGLSHAIRVLGISKKLAADERVNQAVLIVASLFHDIILYPKGSAAAAFASGDSAKEAVSFLKTIHPEDIKLAEQVQNCIVSCTFWAKEKPASLEAKIVHDADIIEQSGVIGIMRTCASSGSLNRLLFHPNDPLCQNRTPECSRFGLDLYAERLIVAKERVLTRKAKELISARHENLLKIGELLQVECKAFSDELSLYSSVILRDDSSPKE